VRRFYFCSFNLLLCVTLYCLLYYKYHHYCAHIFYSIHGIFYAVSVSLYFYEQYLLVDEFMKTKKVIISYVTNFAQTKGTKCPKYICNKMNMKVKRKTTESSQSIVGGKKIEYSDLLELVINEILCYI